MRKAIVLAVLLIGCTSPPLVWVPDDNRPVTVNDRERDLGKRGRKTERVPRRHGQREAR